MLSVKANCPVDPLTVAVLREIDGVARELQLPYFMAGAMARDIVLTHVFGVQTSRATLDVDFAIAVENWQQFNTVKERLVASGLFNFSENAAQRIYYRLQEDGDGYPVDIIPFRGVEEPTHTIAWPPDMKTIMNVIGYEEALASAIHVAIEPELIIPIASLPGLALLKLFAWRDRYNFTPRDAQDLVIISRGYHDAGNLDRLYGEEFGVLETVEYDVDLASPRLLGKDARIIANSATLSQATTLLNDVKLVDRLVTHMAIECKAAEDSIAAAERLLEQFKVGLTQD